MKINDRIVNKIDMNKKKPPIIFKGIFAKKIEKISKVRIILMKQPIKNINQLIFCFFLMHEITNENKDTIKEIISKIRIDTYDTFSPTL